MPPANGQALPTQLPPPGPWCPKCQHEYGPGEIERTQAKLAAEAQLAVECPGCTRKAPPVWGFDAPPAPVKLPEVARPVRAIIESVFRVDYEKEWERLHKNLTVGNERTDHATVAQVLDHGQDNAVDAHKLWVNLRIEYERYKIDREILWAKIRDDANDELQREKDNGLRNKSITDADVTAKMAEMHPDEYRAVELEKKRFELMIEHAKVFAERWGEKPRDLNTILNRMKG